MANKKKGKTGLAFAIWILAILILLIVFLVKKDDILTNLKSTNFFEKIGVKNPTFVEQHEEKPKESNGALEVEIKPVPGVAETETSEKLSTSENIEIQKKDTEIVTPETDSKVTESELPKKSDEKEDSSKSETATKVEKPQTSNFKMCFVSVNSDGTVARKMITRSIPKSDAPLTMAIRSLLSGPTSSEKGLTSLIPEGTRLLSASVKKGIATLNFSEEFEYNAIGADGYRTQLMQVVYTATEFSTVESVQFLVEGERKEYIGSGEDMWMWVGSPYSRDSFN